MHRDSERNDDGGEIPSCPSPQRRQFVKGAVTGLGLSAAFGHVFAETPDEQRPTAGDRLRLADSPSSADLTVADVPIASKPIFAFPYDLASGTLRNGSKLNRILLVRLAEIPHDTQADGHDTKGVLAFSAVCTHEACTVTEWAPAEQCLLCPCHFSKFDVRAGGSVVEGPAPRGLPRLPLRLDGEALIVDGGFSSTPGVRRSG